MNRTGRLGQSWAHAGTEQAAAATPSSGIKSRRFIDLSHWLGGGISVSQDRAAAIAQTKDLNGLTGVITIDEKHNAKKPIVIVQIKKGQPSWVADITDKDMPKK